MDPGTSVREVLEAVGPVAIFRSLPGRYLLLSRDLHILGATDAYMAATSTDLAGLLGRPLFEVFPDNPDDVGASGTSNLLASLQRVIETGEPDTMAVQRYDVRTSGPDGGFERRYWSPVNTPVLVDGEVACIVHAVEDVTAWVVSRADAEREPDLLADAVENRMEAEILNRSLDLQLANEQLRERNRAKDEFLSRMSHELRTPLNAIIGFAGLLERDELTDDQLASVGHISKAGHHLLGLINEVLDMSRVVTGRLAMSAEPVRVADAIDEAVSLMQPAAAGAGIDLTAEEANGLHVLADRQRLKQVLLNLISNGIKYNHRGGTVTVGWSHTAEDHVELRVTDSGDGIAPELLDRLFEPFDRLGAERTGVEGTGLGLALSHGLVHAMGGELTVRTVVGEGSTFLFDLPRAAAPVEQVGPRWAVESEQDLSAGGAVLYIEDNASNVRLVERLLDRWDGVRLLTAMQGRLGVELAREHAPDLVLLDLHLPDLHGSDVLRLLQDDPATRDIPVVVMSADATPGSIDRLLAAGARHYLTKPFDLDEFFEVVAEHCGTASRADTARTPG